MGREGGWELQKQSPAVLRVAIPGLPFKKGAPLTRERGFVKGGRGGIDIDEVTM